MTPEQFEFFKSTLRIIVMWQIFTYLLLIAIFVVIPLNTKPE